MWFKPKDRKKGQSSSPNIWEKIARFFKKHQSAVTEPKPETPAESTQTSYEVSQGSAQRQVSIEVYAVTDDGISKMDNKSAELDVRLNLKVEAAQKPHSEKDPSSKITHFPPSSRLH